MDGWMDGRMDGWVNGWMDGWVGGRMGGLVDVWVNGMHGMDGRNVSIYDRAVGAGYGICNPLDGRSTIVGRKNVEPAQQNECGLDHMPEYIFGVWVFSIVFALLFFSRCLIPSSPRPLLDPTAFHNRLSREKDTPSQPALQPCGTTLNTALCNGLVQQHYSLRAHRPQNDSPNSFRDFGPR